MVTSIIIIIITLLWSNISLLNIKMEVLPSLQCCSKHSGLGVGVAVLHRPGQQSSGVLRESLVEGRECGPT